MSKKTKVWLCIAAAFLVIGCILFAGVMTVLKWDFTKLLTTQYETNTYDITDAYTNISVIADTADITFVPTDDDTVRVVCHEELKLRHSVSVQDDTLTIRLVNEKKWYEYIGNIGINIDSADIKVYMPRGAYGTLSVKVNTGDVEMPRDFTFESMDIQGTTGDVINNASVAETINIKTTTGKVSVSDISVNTLELAVSTGKVTATNITCAGDVTVTVDTGKADFVDVKCANLQTSGDTGKVSFIHVVADNQFSVVRTTGDVTFEECDAAAVFVTTDTGDVKGSLLTDKVFIAQSDTGRISVPETTSGGKCKVTTDTGDIYLTIAD